MHSLQEHNLAVFLILLQKKPRVPRTRWKVNIILASVLLEHHLLEATVDRNVHKQVIVYPKQQTLDLRIFYTIITNN